MSGLLYHIADRVIGRPMLMHPDKLSLITSILSGRIGVDLGDIGADTDPMTPEMSRLVGSPKRADGRYAMSAAVDGVAVIPIIGSLVNRGAYVGASSGVVSYEGIKAQLREAQGDAEIRAVILDLNSPGGEATGMFAVAQAVRDLAAVKPVVAVVDDMAASAAYGIASQATEIVVSPTSIVGSIGVVMTHVDASARLKQEGYSPTLIYAGDHKVDGNSFGPLPEAVREDLQQEVQKFYGLFVDLVAAGRGDKLTAEAARETQARTYLGQDAIAAGLADRMASFSDVLAELSTNTGGGKGRARQSSPKGTTMSDQTPTPSANSVTVDQMNAAVATARTDAAAAERARLDAILSTDAAKANPSLALHLATKSDMSADAVTAALVAAGPAAAPKSPALRSVADRAADGQNVAADAAPQPTQAEQRKAVWGK